MGCMQCTDTHTHTQIHRGVFDLEIMQQVAGRGLVSPQHACIFIATHAAGPPGVGIMEESALKARASIGEGCTRARRTCRAVV
jgi:hypothetical protein